jgi:DNA repair exonuclease SbcCD ATPase subunit
MTSLSLPQVNNRYRRLIGRRDQQVHSLDRFEIEATKAKKDLETVSQAIEVVTQLANGARQEFKTEVDRLVTLAIRGVFDEHFKFDLQLDVKNNRLQCYPVVIETDNGEPVEYDPEDDMGGSILDSIGFAFRILLKKLGKVETRNTLILDEPAKNTGHGELLTRTGQMISELSHSLGLQTILITHDEELMAVADRAWSVKRTKQGSQVIQLQSKSEE